MAKKGKGKHKGHAATAASKTYTNYLAPLSPHEIEAQANKTIRRVFKPGFAELNHEEKRMNAVNEKRKIDNEYYTQWVEGKANQLQAANEASNAKLAAAHANDVSQGISGYQQLHDNLVQGGLSTPGNISNPGEAHAFDVSAEAQRNSEATATGDARLHDAIATQEHSMGDIAANNMALAQAAEAKRQADQWESLSKLGDNRQQLKLAMGAEAAKEISRMFDREVQKSQIRGTMAQGRAETLLAAKKFGLDTEKFGLENQKLGFEEEKFGAQQGLNEEKFGLEGEEAAETKRWHNISKGLKEAETGTKKHEANKKITSVIQEGISIIANHQNLRRTNRSTTVKALMKFLGSSVAASAAWEIFHQGRLSATTRSAFQQLGYTPPSGWR